MGLHDGNCQGNPRYYAYIVHFALILSFYNMFVNRWDIPGCKRIRSNYNEIIFWVKNTLWINISVDFLHSLYFMAKKTSDSAGKTTSKGVSAMAFIKQPDKHINVEAPPPVIVVFGAEPFLRFESIQTLKQLFSSGLSVDESGITVFPASVEYSVVKQELTTMSMFGSQFRLVIVEQANDFIERNRLKLEELIASQEASGTLVMEAVSFPANTRIYKMIAEKGLLINCEAMKTEQLAGWLVERSKLYNANLLRDAAEYLVEKIGDSMGALDQELIKISTYANGKPITIEMVDKLAGSWRSQTAWDMLDNALAGMTDDALNKLDSLLAAGEVPIVILAQLASNLRRMAMANRVFLDARANGRNISINEALRQIGIDKPYVLRKSQSQIERLGIHRASQLLDWMTELDFALKGDSRLDARLLLEQFLMRLSRNS